MAEKDGGAGGGYCQARDVNPPPATPTAPSRRDPGHERWVVVGLVAAAAIGVLLLLLSGVLEPAVETGPGGEVASAEEGAASRLGGPERRTKPLPPDTVEVSVVTRDGGEPVPDVEVRLRAMLASTDGDEGPRARTDTAGRARLRGRWPAFVDLVSDAWTADPSVVAAEGGTAVRFQVVPRTSWRASLLDATTGLPLAGWQLCPAGLASGLAPTWTDSQGAVAWPGLARPPTLVAAGDGRRRVHSFLLYEVPGRTEVRLAMPPVARATRLKVLDPERHPVPGARAWVLATATGVAVDLDASGEADLEYGARDDVPLVVTAAGFVPRRVVLEGRPEETVVLERAAMRRFLVRRPDGTPVPDGTRVRGYTPGPASYGTPGAGLAFAGVVTEGAADITDLPAAAFEGILEVRGPEVYALVRFEAGPDPTAPTEVRAGAPRPFTLRLVRAGEGGEVGPATGLAWVHAPASASCRDGDREVRRALESAVRAGRSDEAVAVLLARTGPDVDVEMPACAEPRSVQVATPSGEVGCVAIGPEDPSGVREIRLSRAGPVATTAPTVLLVEWDDGMPAALVTLRAQGDDAAAAPEEVVTDSSGVGFLSASRGRLTFTAARPDGTRYASDGPLLLPSPGVPLVRLVPAGP
jgi:hypothetical protein